MKKNLTNTIRFISQQFSLGLKLCFCFILIVVMKGSVAAQTSAIKISGKITAATGEALQGVTVAEKNTTNMTTTNVTGDFTLVVQDNAVLVITHIGFQKLEVSVGGKTQLLIKLDALESTLG